MICCTMLRDMRNGLWSFPNFDKLYVTYQYFCEQKDFYLNKALQWVLVHGSHF